jgi:hypothetical protein
MRVADVGIIEGTCLQIGELEVRWHAEREARDARRRRIHEIDDLIEEFERLNLADEAEIPVELRGRAAQLLTTGPPDARDDAGDSLTIAEWMDALYDVQDTLMVPMEDDVD